jgi:hypothetical protein
MKWNLKLSMLGYLSTWFAFLAIPGEGYELYDVWWEGFINHTIAMLQFQFQYKNQMLDFLEADSFKDTDLWLEWQEYEDWEDKEDWDKENWDEEDWDKENWDEEDWDKEEK